MEESISMTADNTQAELREEILNEYLIHEEECSSSLYDEPCDCIQGNVATNIMQPILDWHNKQAEAVVNDIRSLELDDYDDTDPYQQGYMWAIGKAKTVAIEAEHKQIKGE